jgi:hypothetical protein
LKSTSGGSKNARGETCDVASSLVAMSGTSQAAAVAAANALLVRQYYMQVCWMRVCLFLCVFVYASLRSIASFVNVLILRAHISRSLDPVFFHFCFFFCRALHTAENTAANASLKATACQ